MMRVWRLSVAYIGLSREQRPRKTKIGTEVAHVTHDSDITFKIKRSKVNLQGWGILWRPPAQLVVFCVLCFVLPLLIIRSWLSIWLIPILPTVCYCGEMKKSLLITPWQCKMRSDSRIIVCAVSDICNIWTLGILNVLLNNWNVINSCVNIVRRITRYSIHVESDTNNQGLK